MTLTFAIVLSLPSPTFRPGGWQQFGIAIAISGFSITSVYPAIFDGMMNARYIQSLAETESYTSQQRSFMSELARAKQTLGVRGQFRGSSEIGVLYAVLYFGFVLGALPYTVLVFPHLGSLTGAVYGAFAIPTFVTAYLFSYRRSKRFDREATARGLRLEDLHRHIRPRLRSGK